MADTFFTYFWAYLWILLVAIQCGMIFVLRKESWQKIVGMLSGLPAIILLVLFYSLAMHMYVSLKGWPASIGENGFSSGLLLHAQIANSYFTGMIWVTFFIWPMVFLYCLLVPPLRRYTFYSGIYMTSMLLAFMLTQCAPAGFLNWWWD